MSVVRARSGSSAASSNPAPWPVALSPALFGIASMLSFYATNADELAWTAMLVPTLLAAAAGVLISGLAAIVFRRRPVASLLTASALVVFFYWGLVMDVIGTRSLWIGALAIGPTGLGLSGVAAVLGALVWVALKRPDSTGQILRVTAVIACALVVSALVSAVFAYFASTRDAADGASAVASEGTATPQPAGDLPDIYFIVLDAYASDEVLADVAGYDNTGFTGWLRERGFYIADRSHSNYAMSFLSLAGTLNLDYINEQTAAIEGYTQEPVYDLIQNSRAVRTLKEHGYSYVHVASGWGPTEEAPLADEILASETNELVTALLKTTALRSVADSWTADDKYSDVLNAFAYVRDLPEASEPRFVFAHMIVPHAPYVFAADGSRAGPAVPGRAEWDPAYIPAYIDQLEATNALTEQLIDSVIDRDRPCVVIVQGDHGTLFTEKGDPAGRTAFQRHGILNAMYFSDGAPERLYRSISPVNTFRLVFDEYLGTGLGLLDDRSYYSGWRTPYALTDVTDTVNGSSPTP